MDARGGQGGQGRARRGGALARLFLIGDLLDLEAGTFTHLVRPGRRVSALQILAPHELLAGDELAETDVEWVDLESGERMLTTLDGPVRARYARKLEAQVESLSVECHRLRVAFTSRSSARAFEDTVSDVLAG